MLVACGQLIAFHVRFFEEICFIFSDTICQLRVQKIHKLLGTANCCKKGRGIIFIKF